MLVRPLNTFSQANRKKHCLLQPKYDHARLPLHHRNLKIIPLKVDHSEPPIFIFNNVPHLTSFTSLWSSESYVLSPCPVFKLGSWVSLTPGISFYKISTHWPQCPCDHGPHFCLCLQYLWSPLKEFHWVAECRMENRVHWNKWKHTLRLREAFSQDHALSEWVCKTV